MLTYRYSYAHISHFCYTAALSAPKARHIPA